MSGPETLIVIAKEPRSGRVKTRLVPPLTFEQAADVAAAALRDTLEAVGGVGAAQSLLCFDGDPTGWCPAGWRVASQTGGGLDRRLVGAFAAAGAGPALLVGMDTPQVRPAHLAGWDRSRYDACLGLASDGGYWAIGLADPALAAAAIDGVPMSVAHTGHVQLERLTVLGLRVQLLAELTDVDDIATARTVAELAPDSRFADALRRAQASVPELC